MDLFSVGGEVTARVVQSEDPSLPSAQIGQFEIGVALPEGGAGSVAALAGEARPHGIQSGPSHLSPITASIRIVSSIVP